MYKSVVKLEGLLNSWYKKKIASLEMAEALKTVAKIVFSELDGDTNTLEIQEMRFNALDIAQKIYTLKGENEESVWTAFYAANAAKDLYLRYGIEKYKLIALEKFRIVLRAPVLNKMDYYRVQQSVFSLKGYRI